MLSGGPLAMIYAANVGAGERRLVGETTYVVKLVWEHQIWVRVRQGHGEVLSSIYMKLQCARLGIEHNLQSDAVVESLFFFVQPEVRFYIRGLRVH